MQLPCVHSPFSTQGAREGTASPAAQHPLGALSDFPHPTPPSETRSPGLPGRRALRTWHPSAPALQARSRVATSGSQDGVFVISISQMGVQRPRSRSRLHPVPPLRPLSGLPRTAQSAGGVKSQAGRGSRCVAVNPNGALNRALAPLPDPDSVLGCLRLRVLVSGPSATYGYAPLTWADPLRTGALQTPQPEKTTWTVGKDPERAESGRRPEALP